MRTNNVVTCLRLQKFSPDWEFFAVNWSPPTWNFPTFLENFQSFQQQPRKGKYKHAFASTIYLQVVGSGAHGAPRSLYVFTEHCRYFFNCGEGTQRLSSEHKVKLSMLEHVFITHKSWENVGGLPGALLTLQDAGVPKITIHGPPGVESLYNDTKHFMRFRNLQINYHHYESNEGLFDEGPLLIQAAPLWSEDNNISQKQVEIPNEREVEDMFAHEKNIVSTTETNSTSKNPEISKEKLQESVTCRDLSIAYICRPVPKPGALLPDRCRELGVPKGPLMGKLKNGNDVTLPNGDVVKAADVTQPPNHGPVFIVLEVPSVSYLGSLVTNKALAKHNSDGAAKDEDLASVVVHFTPSEVLAEPRYASWLATFPSTTTHIFINANSMCMGSERVHKIQYKLNHIYPQAFPLLNEAETISNGTSDDNSLGNVKRVRRDMDNEQSCDNSFNVEHLKQENCLQAFTCLTYHVRPHLAVDKSKQIEIHPEIFIKECYDFEEFKPTYTKVKAKIEDIRENLPEALRDRLYPNILFLGTGSCIPNKTRNTSGMALNISETSSMLMDCGEGTYGQLVRFMGYSAAENFLRRLHIIYISHLHADHHIGLIRVLLARKRAYEKVQQEGNETPKLLLLAPKGILHYLSSYSVNVEDICDLFTMVPNDRLIHSDKITCDREKVSTFCTKNLLEVEHIQTCFVFHCPNAYGVAVTLENGWKVVYSGDTMPCQALVQIGQNCDLLIHEATMEDELSEDAKLKRHSTTSQAVDIGSQMKAKYVILTHFSQRYAKVPLIDKVPENVGVAFDNMVVRLSDLPCLSHLYPAYVTIFSEDVDEMIKKRMKIKIRSEINENDSVT